MSHDLRLTKTITSADIRAFTEQAGRKDILVRTDTTDGTQILFTADKPGILAKNADKMEHKAGATEARKIIEQKLGFVFPGDPSKCLTGSKLHKELNRCSNSEKMTIPGKGGEGTMNVEVPKEVKFNGKTYTWESHIASAGYGHVHEFKPVEGGENIAVKISYSTEKNKPKEAAQEFAIHDRVAKGGKHAVGFIGVTVNTADGSTIIGMPMAGKDVDKVTDKLRSAGLPDKVFETAVLTLAHDMAKGIEQTAKVGVIHLDVKPDNFLVDKNGKALITDFGQSVVGDKHDDYYKGNPMAKMTNFHIGLKHITDGNRTPPDLERESKLMDSKYKSAENTFNIRYDLDLTNEGLSRKQIAGRRTEHLTNLGLTPDKDTVQTLTTKADTWQLGLTIHRMLTGDAVPEKFQDGIRKKGASHTLNEYASDRTNRLFDGENLSEGEKLVNKCSHPDAQSRPTMTEFLNDEVFENNRGVGSKDARELIKSVIAGDAKKIQEHSWNLTYLY
jgi:serine/threonine protein kinase